ncbi:tail fiber domain-containing protein [Pseudomonadota bacterium]
MDETGYVGVGTATPTTPLHVVRDDDASLTVENTTETSLRRLMLYLKNKGAVRIEMSTGNRPWYIDNVGKRIQITRTGTGRVELRLHDNGNLEIAGALTQNSSQVSKQDIEQVNTEEALAKVMALPIKEWSYKRDASVRHLGPMAEDFHAAFGLGNDNKGIATIDTSGVALAAIQGLKTEQDAKLKTLRVENQSLKTELAELKQLVQQLVSQDKVALVR